MTDTPNRFVEGLKLTVLVLAIAFVAFVGGGVTTLLKWKPVELFMQQTAMAALYFYKSSVDAEALDPFWSEAHLPGAGADDTVVRHDPDAAWQGLNLYVQVGVQGATLTDMNGKVVHEWRLRFDEIWDAAPHVASYGEEEPVYWEDKIYWRRVHLYPNGDLLVIFESPFRTPYGFGLAKLDKNSNVLWKLSNNAHHDTAIGPSGEIFLLTQEVRKQPYPVLHSLKPPFIDDMVTVISAEGEPQQEISIIEAFLNSEYEPMLERLNRGLLGDVLHANAVQYIDRTTAARFPFAEEGHLLLSMREMDTIALLDPTTKSIVWADTGLWRRQHEPQFLDNGRILLFDNQGHRGPEGITRVIEYDPVTHTIDWSYAGTFEEPLISAIYGSQQRLPNGNTLIVESTNGRAIEVTPDGRIVWDFRLTERMDADGKEMVRIMTDLIRVDPRSLVFLD